MATSMTGNRGAAGLAQQGNAAGGNIIPKGYRQGQLQQFGPEQMQLFQRLFGSVSPDSYLARLAGGDESAFEQYEKPAWRALGEAQGQLGSRFSQLSPGAMSAQRGSGFKNAASQQSMDFAERLAAQRHALQSSALSQMHELSSSLLNQRPNEQFLVQKQLPFWKQLLLNINEQGANLAPVAAKFAAGV